MESSIKYLFLLIVVACLVCVGILYFIRDFERTIDFYIYQEQQEKQKTFPKN